MVVYQIQSIKYIGFQFNAIETNHLVKESFRLFIQNWDKTLNIFQNISNEILLFLFVSQSKEKKTWSKKSSFPAHVLTETLEGDSLGDGWLFL